MATFTLSPQWVQQPLSDIGAIVPNGKLYTYEAGSSLTPATTYQTSTGTANTNPIVLDTFGRVPTAIYLVPGQSYRFIFKTAAGVTIKDQDNILATAPVAVNVDIVGVAGENLVAGDIAYLSDGSNSLVAGTWYLADADAIYASTTPEIAGVVDSITQGATGTLRTSGQFTYATGGLVVGALYYVSATAGRVTLTPPVNARPVGQADSGTTLIFDPNPAPYYRGGDSQIVLGAQIFN